MPVRTVKAITIFSLIIVFSLPFSFAGAESGAPVKSGADDILKVILQTQNVSKVSELKCINITDTQFEELGEAVMDVMHPDEKEHQLMDQMMGGEGSDSLRAAHILMGRNYLGCGSSIGMSGGAGMMGGGMMSGMGMMGSRGGISMMDGSGQKISGSRYLGMMSGWPAVGSGFGWLWMVVFWALLIVGIIVLIKWLSYANGGKRQGKSALKILEERYARGEINKQEFEKRKKDLVC